MLKISGKIEIFLKIWNFREKFRMVVSYANKYHHIKKNLATIFSG